MSSITACNPTPDSTHNFCCTCTTTVAHSTYTSTVAKSTVCPHSFGNTQTNTTDHPSEQVRDFHCCGDWAACFG